MVTTGYVHVYRTVAGLW